MKKIFWKGYFYFTILSYLMVLTDTFPVWLVILDIGVSIFAIIGLYEYIWGKSILNKVFLKYNFVIQALWTVFLFYYTWQNFTIYVPENFQKETMFIVLCISMIVGLVLFCPLFYALYMHSFKSKKLG